MPGQRAHARRHAAVAAILSTKSRILISYLRLLLGFLRALAVLVFCAVIWWDWHQRVGALRAFTGPATRDALVQPEGAGPPLPQPRAVRPAMLMVPSRQPDIHTKFGPALFSITFSEMFQFVEPSSEYTPFALSPPPVELAGPLSCR